MSVGSIISDLDLLSWYCLGPSHYARSVERRPDICSTGAVAHLSEAPFLVHQEAEVIVRHDGGAEGPRAFETASVGVTPSQSVCTAQGHNLSVVEAHAAEYRAQVALLLGSVRQATVGCAHCHVFVVAAWPPRDDGTLHFLDGADTSKRPEIGVGDPRELLCTTCQSSRSVRVMESCSRLTGSKKSRAALRPEFAP